MNFFEVIRTLKTKRRDTMQYHNILTITTTAKASLDHSHLQTLCAWILVGMLIVARRLLTFSSWFLFILSFHVQLAYSYQAANISFSLHNCGLFVRSAYIYIQNNISDFDTLLSSSTYSICHKQLKPTVLQRQRQTKHKRYDMPHTTRYVKNRTYLLRFQTLKRNVTTM